MDSKIRDRKSVQVIKERISNPKKLFRLVLNKQDILWARLDDSVEWGFSFYKNTGINILGKNITYPVFIRIVQKAEKTFYVFILIMATLGLLLACKRKNNTIGVILILLIILINFGIYSLIEIQNRYRDFQVIFIFLIAAVGIESFASINFNRIFLFVSKTHSHPGKIKNIATQNTKT